MQRTWSNKEHLSSSSIWTGNRWVSTVRVRWPLPWMSNMLNIPAKSSTCRGWQPINNSSITIKMLQRRWWWKRGPCLASQTCSLSNSRPIRTTTSLSVNLARPRWTRRALWWQREIATWAPSASPTTMQTCRVWWQQWPDWRGKALWGSINLDYIKREWQRTYR